MQINKKLKKQLLQFFKSFNKSQALTDLGYNKEQVNSLVEKLILEGLIVEKENKIFITSKGQSLLSENQHNFDWIQPEKKSKIDKIDKNDVFLP